jgi:CheY-like chemotaxis protein
MNGKSGTLNILVVEDEPILRADVAGCLTDAGCVVLEAASGEDALSMLARNPQIDALFTDIRLGDSVNGWDVAEAFRASHGARPVIYTSGNATSPARPVEGSLFFAKPYAPTEIFNACRLLAQADVPPAASPSRLRS